MLNGLWVLHDDAGDGEAIRQATSDAARLEAIQARMTELERRLENLNLVCMGLWALLRQRGRLSEQHLMDAVERVDLLDGELDAPLPDHVAKCPHCNSVMSARHSHCMYCGSEWLNVVGLEAPR